MTRWIAPVLFAGLVGLAPAADKKKLGASIDGYRWEFGCKEPMPENPAKGANCTSALVKGDPKKTDNFTAEKEFEGEKGKRTR